MASSVSSSTNSLFQFGGLASGLDTTSIVDSIITAESGPLNRIKQRQDDYKVQISTLGTLVTQLKDLQKAATSLSTNGVVSIAPTSSYSDFSFSGSAKSEGSYGIRVEQLAKEAKIRSTSFTSAQDAAVVPDGNLLFSIDGTNTIAINTTGKTLADIAETINQGISELNASVISTSSGYYLNVSRKSTGYASSAEEALSVVSDPGLGLSLRQLAQNAKVYIDDLEVERSSNTLTDVIPGATMQLTASSNIEKNVTFAADSKETEATLNQFVTAYNTVVATVRSQLVTDPNTRYGDTLLDHSSMSSLQSSLQRMLSQVVVPTGSVRILADLGMELQQDGTLSLDVYDLEDAISSNPGAVNAIFSTANTGIASTISTLVGNQTNKLTGSLVVKQTSLESSISDLDDRALQLQSNLDSRRERLLAQFVAMESLISGFTNATNYLAQVEGLKISK